MVKIRYIAHDGAETVVDGKAGDSVMITATANGVDGIVGECGGSAMCATCHVYVDEAWLDRLAPVEEVEDVMLDATECERRGASRLGCQIELTENLDGLVVHMPERQR